MNFLLHRHLATRELDSAVAGVGAMLPDLWRMADRRMRARRNVPALGDVRKPTEAVAAGVVHHLEADVWFHRTTVFVDGERALSRQLVDVRVPKLVLFGHAAWEMCLDGALLLSQNFDDALNGLRVDMESAESAVDAVADLHGAGKLADRPRFAEHMDRLRDGLLAGRWIRSYQSGDGLAQCVGGMRKRFALPVWSEDQEAVTACILEEALQRAQEELPKLLAARTVSLSEAS